MPIFLSVGYSTCYWCHVMEREVFSNPEIAALMNANFINIKVDREQRPDLDEIYMMATRLMIRRGGWPNSVFLTPDLKPFHAGTYIGPTDQGSRPGFPTLVRSLSDDWVNRRAAVIAKAEQQAANVRRVLYQSTTQGLPATMNLVDAAIRQMARRYDARNGGFGAAPKFPQGFTYAFLLDATTSRGHDSVREMTVRTLRMMAAGGMYDHVGGGFHRYSTDGQWRVPHFEKMLYNQAQLARTYARAYEVTNDALFADVARDILRYVDDLMTGPDGQFYSALDAETDAVEGAYYVWNRASVLLLLDEQERDLFDAVFGIGAVPTFRGHKHPDGGVVYMRQPLDELARARGEDYTVLRGRVDDLLSKLKAVRDLRKLPRLDDKVIAGWNGLMIDAHGFAGQVLDDSSLIETARRAGRFLLEEMIGDDGRLLRIWRKGVAEQPAFQEDYAFVIRGLLTLRQATGDDAWLEHATRLAEVHDRLFAAPGGGYYFAPNAPDLIARSTNISEGAIPSGNAVMAHNFVGLWQATGNSGWRDRASRTLDAFSGRWTRAPSGYLHMTHAAFRLLQQAEEADAVEGPAPFRLPSADVTQPLSSDRHVTVSATANPTTVRRGTAFEIRVRLRIDDAWHVNANPASSAELIPTVAALRGTAPVQVIDVKYPLARTLTASYARQPISVYAGRPEIVITAILNESAPVGRTIPLTVLVQFQACNDDRCLPPSEKLIDVPIGVTN